MAGSKKPERPFAGLTRSTLLLAAASFFADVSTEMLYPVLPVFLTQVLGASGAALGLMEGLAQAAQNLAQGLSGSLSDRLHRRKPLAMVGFALAALSKPLIGLSAAWPAALGARFADRVATGVRSAPRDALVAASADEAHRGKAFGLEGAGDNAGAFVGPLLAVALLTLWRLDLRALFWLAVIPGGLALLMVTLVREGRSDGPEAKARLDTPPWRFSGAYLRYLVVVGLFGLGASSSAFLILQTRALGASLPLTILIYAAVNLVAALTSYPAGALSDRLGRRRLFVLALAVFAVVYLGLALASNAWAVAALFVLYGVYQGVFRAVGKSMAADLAPAERRAGAIGWFNAVVGLTGLVASAVAGLLWDNVGHRAVFASGAVISTLAVVAGLVLIRPRRGAGAAS